MITFTSSSTVSNLLETQKEDFRITTWPIIASNGPKTTETAIKAGIEVDITADEQTIAGLVAAIEDYFGKKLAW